MKLKKKNKKVQIYELINTLIIALVLAGIIRTILFQPFWIPDWLNEAKFTCWRFFIC